MSSDDIAALVKAAIAEVVPEAELDDVDPSEDLRDELDIDSMDFLNIVIDLHARSGVEIPERDYDRIRTIDAMVAYLRDHRAAST